MRIIFIAVTFTMLAASAALAGDAEFSLRHIPESAWAKAPADIDEPAWLDDDGTITGEGPSMRKAVLYSLVLPGWGDHYAGRKQRARFFFISEAAIWGSFAVFKIQGHQDEDAYKRFAVQFAGITRSDHSDDFYAELREWNDSAEYEEWLKILGRGELFPDVSSSSLTRYYLENRIDEFEPWEWESFERRLQYGELRSASKAAYRRANYSLLAAGINRVVSAIFAYQAVKSQRGDDEALQGSYRLDISPSSGRYDATVSLVRTF